MARILKKVPNFKLPKYKMRDIDEIEELKVDYTDEFIKNLDKKAKKRLKVIRELITGRSRKYL